MNLEVSNFKKINAQRLLVRTRQCGFIMCLLNLCSAACAKDLHSMNIPQIVFKWKPWMGFRVRYADLAKGQLLQDSLNIFHKSGRFQWQVQLKICNGIRSIAFYDYGEINDFMTWFFTNTKFNKTKFFAFNQIAFKKLLSVPQKALKSVTIPKICRLNGCLNILNASQGLRGKHAFLLDTLL